MPEHGTVEETDWVRIAALYEALARVAGSPIVELNRAVALGMAFGPEVGLRSVDALAAEGTLDGYHLLPSVRGDLLAKLGRWAEARAEFERAASMTQNGRERELLLARAAECAGRGASRGSAPCEARRAARRTVPAPGIPRIGTAARAERLSA